jgi:hypothetical protein
MTATMPAKRVRIGVWEALLPLGLGLVVGGIAAAVGFGLLLWPVGLGLWMLVFAAFVTFVWIRSARQKATLQPGEWLEVEEPRWIPGDRAFGLFFVVIFLTLFVFLVIATIAIAVGE